MWMTIDPRSVPEIKEAVELLEKYERGGATYADAKMFKDAIEGLGDYLDENPDSPHREFIQNVRTTYTRRMMQRLSKVNKADLNASLEHIILVVHTVRAEADKLKALFPEMKLAWKALIGEWAEPIARALVDREEREEREREKKTHT